jgi:hypothetical protein
MNGKTDYQVYDETNKMLQVGMRKEAIRLLKNEGLEIEAKHLTKLINDLTSSGYKLSRTDTIGVQHHSARLEIGGSYREGRFVSSILTCEDTNACADGTYEVMPLVDGRKLTECGLYPHSVVGQVDFAHALELADSARRGDRDRLMGLLAA